ncbi:hypothetical protein KY284_031015 [Solanum tuberosum]|nr:hypothetical protein KY284_031015 [Solanum tuberosum]
MGFPSQRFNCESRMKWRTCYEHLENSSIGLSFPSVGRQSIEIIEDLSRPYIPMSELFIEK